MRTVAWDPCSETQTWVRCNNEPLMPWITCGTRPVKRVKRLRGIWLMRGTSGRPVTFTICPSGFRTMTTWWLVIDHRLNRIRLVFTHCFDFIPKQQTFGLIWSGHWSLHVWLFTSSSWTPLILSTGRTNWCSVPFSFVPSFVWVFHPCITPYAAIRHKLDDSLVGERLCSHCLIALSPLTSLSYLTPASRWFESWTISLLFNLKNSSLFLTK